MQAYAPDRVSRLAEISTKFTSVARVGDEIHLGIEGDSEMPARYRGAGRPTGVITKIKNEGTDHATLRVRLRSGSTVDLHPYSIDGSRVWEYTPKAWENVLARNGLAPDGPSSYRGSATNGELLAMRKEMADMSSKFNREMAEAKEFNSALVESIAAMTGEIVQANPDAKYSAVFQREYKGQSRQMAQEASLFDSDFEGDD